MSKIWIWLWWFLLMFIEWSLVLYTVPFLGEYLTESYSDITESRQEEKDRKWTGGQNRKSCWVKVSCILLMFWYELGAETITSSHSVAFQNFIFNSAGLYGSNDCPPLLPKKEESSYFCCLIRNLIYSKFVLYRGIEVIYLKGAILPHTEIV